MVNFDKGEIVMSDIRIVNLGDVPGLQWSGPSKRGLKKETQ